MIDDTKIIQINLLFCARCHKPIARGSTYYPVMTPAGEKPVHPECLEAKP